MGIEIHERALPSVIQSEVYGAKIPVLAVLSHSDEVFLCVIQSGVCGAKNPGPSVIQS